MFSWINKFISLIKKREIKNGIIQIRTYPKYVLDFRTSPYFVIYENIDLLNNLYDVSILNYNHDNVKTIKNWRLSNFDKLITLDDMTELHNILKDHNLSIKWATTRIKGFRHDRIFNN